MLCVPLFHVTGLVPVMLGAFVGGSKLVMTYKWDPERALELIERERVTSFVGVPTMSWDLLEAPTFADRDTSSLTSVGGGGAPMPPELVKRIDDNFRRGRPSLGYGMTETNAYGPGNSGDDFITHPTSHRATGAGDGHQGDRPARQRPPAGRDRRDLVPRSDAHPRLLEQARARPPTRSSTAGCVRGDIGRIDDEGFVYVRTARRTWSSAAARTSTAPRSRRRSTSTRRCTRRPCTASRTSASARSWPAM